MSERCRNLLRAGWLVAPLDERMRHGGCISVGQVGLERHQRARLLPRGNNERRAIPVRGEDVAHRVTHAHGRMQIDEGGVVRRLRVAVRHAHDYRFLQAEHVAEVLGETSKQRQLRGAGVAEDRSHPDGAQQVQDGCADSHRDFSVLHEAWRGHRH